MANLKLSQLSTLASVQATDLFYAVRAGVSYAAQLQTLYDVFPLKTQTPTNEELTASYFINSAISASLAFGVWIAPFNCKITWAGIMHMSGAIAASDTDYWTVLLRRLRADTPATIASKTTKTTGGEAVAQRTYWGFDGASFDAGNQVLALGDAVDFRFEKTLSPSNWNSPLLCLRYEPT